jgi:hypothetical protein
MDKNERSRRGDTFACEKIAKDVWGRWCDMVYRTSEMPIICFFFHHNRTPIDRVITRRNLIWLGIPTKGCNIHREFDNEWRQLRKDCTVRQKYRNNHRETSSAANTLRESSFKCFSIRPHGECSRKYELMTVQHSHTFQYIISITVRSEYVTFGVYKIKFAKFCMFKCRETAV